MFLIILSALVLLEDHLNTCTQTNQIAYLTIPLIFIMCRVPPIKNGEQRTKKTTFNVPKGGGVPKDRNNLNHLMLARDHSLGRDYFQPGEAVDVGDFDWDEPVENLSAEDVATPSPAPPPPAGPPGHRGGASGGSAGWGSGQFAYIEPPSSATKSPHSPHHKHYSPPSREGSGTYYPPPPPLPGGDVRVMSASSFPGPPPPPGGAYPYPPSGSFPPPPPHPGAPREHSLAGYPLRNASVSSSARDSFAGSDVERSRSYDEAYWQGHPQYGPPPPGGYAYPPPSPYQGSPRHGAPPYPPHPQDYQPPPYGYPDQSAFDRRSSKSDIPQPPLPPEQRQWSGQSADYQRVAEIIGQEGGNQEDPHGYKRAHSKNDDKDGPAKPKGGLRRKISGDGVIPPPPDGAIDKLKSTLPRPETVKRDTSHQCETEETKRRVQRSRLQRDHSLAGVALNGGDVAHEALSPREYEFSDPSSKAASEKSGASSDIAMRALSASMRQSSIGEKKPASTTKSTPKPPTLSADQRLTTVDAVRMAFEGDDDVLGGAADDSNKCNEDPNTKEVAPELIDGKPGSLTLSDRITTSDALSFAGIVDDKVLDGDKKPLPLADDLRLSTGGTVDNILASVEETVGDVVAGLSSDVDSSINALGRPPSISTEGRLSTADSMLAPPDADDLAAEFLTKDAALE